MKTLCNPMSTWSYLPRPLIQLHSTGPSFDAKPFLFLCLMFLPESHSMFKRAEHSPAQLLHLPKKHYWIWAFLNFLLISVSSCRNSPAYVPRAVACSSYSIMPCRGCNFWCELQCNIQLQCPKGVYSVCVVIASRHVFNWHWLRYMSYSLYYKLFGTRQIEFNCDKNDFFLHLEFSFPWLLCKVLGSLAQDKLFCFFPQACNVWKTEDNQFLHAQSRGNDDTPLISIGHCAISTQSTVVMLEMLME